MTKKSPAPGTRRVRLEIANPKPAAPPAGSAAGGPQAARGPVFRTVGDLWSGMDVARRQGR